MSERAIFNYGLHALLRKKSVELDLAKEQLAEASARVEVQTRELELSSTRLMQLESDQRDLSREGALIDVDARMRLHACLGEAVVQKQQRAAQLEDAKAEHEKTLEALGAARRELKAIERHREQAAVEFETQVRRRAQLASDELYLSNAGARSLASKQTGSGG